MNASAKIALVAAALGCTSEPERVACTPGIEAPCECENGERGVAVCEESGSYGACDCSALIVDGSAMPESSAVGSGGMTPDAAPAFDGATLRDAQTIDGGSGGVPGAGGTPGTGASPGCGAYGNFADSGGCGPDSFECLPDTVRAVAVPKVEAGSGPMSCGLRADGSAACWGLNSSMLAVPQGVSFKDIAVGNLHACGVATDGTVTCWGDNGSGQALAPPGVYLRVVAGQRYACAIGEDCRIACWGDLAPPFIDSALADIEGADLGPLTLRPNGYVESWLPGGGSFPAPFVPFAQVSGGDRTACGILELDGSLRCWWLQPPSSGPSEPPQRTGTFRSVSVGASFSCALKPDDTLTCWGNESGADVAAPLGRFTQISVGGAHACGLRVAGSGPDSGATGASGLEAVCWGDGSAGQTSPPGDFP